MLMGLPKEHLLVSAKEQHLMHPEHYCQAEKMLHLSLVRLIYMGFRFNNCIFSLSLPIPLLY